MNVLPSLPMTVKPSLQTLNPVLTTTATINPSSALPQPFFSPFNTIANVPVSHVIPSMTAWVFPYVPVNPSVHVSRPLPQSHPNRIAATTASSGSKQLPTTTPVLPVTFGGTVYFLEPPVAATPAVADTSTQLSTLFRSASATPFVPSSVTHVTQTRVSSCTIQDVT